MAVRIRAARPDDGRALQAIELAAGERFRDVGLGFVADHEPASVEELATYADDGRSWVAVEQDDVTLGYVLADVVDGNGHVEQVSVLPDRQGTGIGRALVDQVRDWAAGGGMTALTLTTFTDVAWNRPLYEHLGFRVLADDEIGPELRALMAAEAAHGLDPATRVAMRIDLTPPRGRKRVDPFAALTLVAGLATVVSAFVGLWGLTALVAALASHAVADRRINRRPTARTGRKLSNLGLGLALVGAVAGLGVFLLHSPRRGDYTIQSLHVGECYMDEPAGRLEVPGRSRTVESVVACSDPHRGEVFLNVEIDLDAYPGQGQLFADGHKVCEVAFARYVGRSLSSSHFTASDWEPDEDSWEQGVHSRVCSIRAQIEREDLPTRSLRGSRR